MRIQPAALRPGCGQEKMLEMDIRAEIKEHEVDFSQIRDAVRRLYDNRRASKTK